METEQWEELAAWEQREHLDGIAAAIRVKGAQHHPAIQAVLCGRCEHGLVYRQRSGNAPVRVICQKVRGGIAMPLDIDECSQFEGKDAQTVTLEDMTKVALTIDLRKAPPLTNAYL